MPKLAEPIGHPRPREHAACLAETATRLLPHLAVGLFRCIQQGQPTEHLIKAIAKCGKYLNAAERNASHR